MDGRNKRVIAFFLTCTFIVHIFIACACVGAQAASLFNPSARGLYADKRARVVGDLVTIMIVENAQATNSTQTSTGKNVSANAEAGGAIGTFSADAGLGNAYRNTGTTSSRGALVAKMTARVEEVLPNGDLIIAGTRTITVNNEKQTLSIRGVVRADDIAMDNSVTSGQVGNAEIRFTGSPDWQKKTGVLANTWEAVKAFFAWIF